METTFGRFRLFYSLSSLLFVAGALPSLGQDTNFDAPVILGATGIDNRVQVTFSLPVDLATATNLANYSISNLYGAVAVLEATPGTNGAIIQLRTGHQLPFMAHWVTISGVADALTGTNVIAPNSQSLYTNLAFTTGYIKSDFYLGITGTTLSALTNNPKFPDFPNRTSYLPDSYWFDGTVGANYGNRMSGILVAPASGLYTFVIYTPAVGVLSLSTNEDPSNKKSIASCQSQNFTPSAPVPLVGGQRYYLESLSKEGTSPSDFAEIVWSIPPNSNNWALLPMDHFGGYLTDPAATIRIAHQPENASVYDDRRATFAIDAVGFSKISTNLNYQWQLNGVDIPGATDAAYTTPPVFETNSGWSYRVFAYVPGAAVFSENALLTVTQDLVPPSVLQTYNFGTTNVQLLFSEEVEQATATDLRNYAFADGPVITGAVLDFSGTVVTLTTSPLAYGDSYSLLIHGVQDRAMVPNTIASNSVVVISVKPSTSQDIGNPAIAATAVLRAGGIDISASGKEIGGLSDQFNLNYQMCAGDFDVCVRVAGLSSADLWAKAGLMARETLDPWSRFAAALATPSMNGGTFEYRDPTNTAAISTGSFVVNYPDTWLRLQRLGDYLMGYASYDGHTWAPLGGAYFTNLPSALFVGLAADSHDTTQRAVAQFRDWQLVGPDAVIGVVQNPREPLGPSSRKSPIAISEIMYKPAPRTDGKNTEFLELYNSNPWFHDLSGFRIVANNLSYTVPAGTVIPGGSFLVVAASPQSMRDIYGINNVIGPYSGTLQSTDTLQLFDEQGALLLTVPYSNRSPWPVAADGSGHSLVLTSPSYGEEDPRAWDISDVYTGSPGAADSYHPDPLRKVRINELLAHTEDPTIQDFVELYNHSDQTNDLSGCALTDDPLSKKFVVPSGTILGPGGFISFDRTQLGFGLSAVGETLYLLTPDGLRILDAVQYEAQADGVSLGRWPDGADAFYPMAARTPGAANRNILVRDIVINELMYDPISGNDDDQYIELYNQGTNLVSLAGWQFTSGITFTFPTNAVLAPESYLVIARDRTNLFAKYPNLNPVNTLGDFTGKLSHSGERVALAMPQLLNGTQTLFVVEDEVTYGAGGRWGQWAAGGGSSLELTDSRSNHRLAANWADSDDTQKSTWVNIEATGTLDNGHNYGPNIGYAQLGPLDAGECLIDNVEVHAGTGTVNYLRNPGFETGLTDWSIQGCMTRSSLENTGYGGSGHSLHVRCSSRIWTGANSCQATLNANTLGSGQTATLRFKARWLHGWPEVLLRLNGNWLEAVGTMPVPSNLGTPGARNSRSLSNPGPAIYEVTHSPAVPTYGQDVVVTARVDDPDGIASLTLNYRLDSDTSYTKVTMKDDGTGGDAVAQDGLFSATLPGAYGIVAYYLSATDNRGAVTRFPALLNDNSPVRECVVMFGDENPGGSFASYHLWLTQSNVDLWSSLPDLSNEMIDGTFVCGNRVIYNMSARYAGSPYHQGFYSPLYSPCHYKFQFPDDDKFLGATSFNKIHAPGNGAGDDSSLQREQTAYTFMRALGVPWLNRRYVSVYVNGYHTLPLMEDTQCPDADMVKEYFPNDTGGFLYKMQPWFEFTPFPSSYYLDFNNVSWCTVMPYTSAGKKKTARYRYNFEIRRTPDSANNFTNVFSLVDAASAPSSANYAANLESLAEMENWMRVFAANHAAGNWDSFGAQNAQNLYGYIGTQGTRYSLLMFDFNIVLGNSGSWGPGQNLYTVNSADSSLARIFITPLFRRMYVRALAELVKGPLDVANTGPLVDAKYSTFVANGLSVEGTAGIKSWLTSAKSGINSQISSQVNAPFLVSPAGQVVNNVAMVSGSAPVGVKTLLINGVGWPVTWTSVTTWMVTLPLRPGTNAFSVVGIDTHGHPIEGATGISSAVYDGALAPPQGQIVMNEIMYHPTVPNAQYLELYNASTNYTFDLSGWQIPALGYTFPPASSLGPTRFLVLAQNRTIFAGAYGATIPVFDTFSIPPAETQTLSLVRPGGDGSTETVAEVRYEAAAPWPTEATGLGGSLQLIDSSKDNWRVGNWAGGSSTPLFSPGAANNVRANLPDFPAVVLNEVQAENVTGVTNAAGQRTAWAEIYNTSSNLVSLEGLYLSDNYTNLSQWAFPPGTVILPRSFKVVFCDGNTDLSTATELHASFNLTAGTGALALSLLDTNGTPRILDYLNYTNLAPDHSYGAIPNGQGLVRAEMLNATPGATNINSGTTLSVAINEWMAGNTQTIKDPVTGKYEDWFELYNFGDTPASLAGYYLSHSITNEVEFRIPNGFTIPPGGFLLVWADKQLTNGTPDLHVNFKLSKSGTSICLRSPTGALIDYVNFGPQTSDLGMGRYPDGSGGIFILPNATPGTRNAPPNTAPTLRATGDRFMYFGQTLSLAAQAQDNDFPPQSLTYSLDPGSPTNATINALTGLLAWTPTTRQVPSTNLFILRVTDNGIPPLSASEVTAVIVAVPPPLTASSANNQVTLAWAALSGQTYQLQVKDDLSAPDWTNLGPTFTGAGDTISLSPTNDFTGTAQRFFRLKVLP